MQSRLEEALEVARANERRIMQEVTGLMCVREEAEKEAARLSNELASVSVCSCLLHAFVWQGASDSHNFPCVTACVGVLAACFCVAGWTCLHVLP